MPVCKVTAVVTLHTMVWVQGPGWPDHLCKVIAAYVLRLNSLSRHRGFNDVLFKL